MRFRAEARQAKPKHCILIGARKMAAFLLSVCACMCVVTTTKFILVLTICPAQTAQQQQRQSIWHLQTTHTDTHTHTHTQRHTHRERVSVAYLFSLFTSSTKQAAGSKAAWQQQPHKGHYKLHTHFFSGSLFSLFLSFIFLCHWQKSLTGFVSLPVRVFACVCVCECVCSLIVVVVLLH